MNDTLDLAFIKPSKAIKALEEVVALPPQQNNIQIDACTQRFEFTFDLFWKLLQKILAHEGIIASYPKQVLREAYQSKLIDDEQMWISMLNDRNNTSHTYNEDLANEIYGRIAQNYFPVLHTSYENLVQKYKNQPTAP